MQSIPNTPAKQIEINCPIIAYLPDESRPSGRRELNVWGRISIFPEGDGVFHVEPYDCTPVEIYLTDETMTAIADALHNAARQYDQLDALRAATDAAS